MTVTELEIVERAEEETKPPLYHCYCIMCAHLQAPNEIRAMCGGGRLKSLKDLNYAGPMPEADACVVCMELAPQRCPGCGI